MQGFMSQENESTDGGSMAPEKLAALTKFQAQLEAAKVSGDLMPALETFLNTSFLVRVAPRSGPDDTSDFKFAVRLVPRDEGEQPMVVAAETPELLAAPGDTGVGALEMTGGNLVRTVGPDFGILIGLPEGGFAISKEQCQWLRDSTAPVGQ